MAIARPVRALIVVSILLWCFFLYQLLGATSSIQVPERYSHEQDPNMERKSHSVSWNMNGCVDEGASEGWIRRCLHVQQSCNRG